AGIRGLGRLSGAGHRLGTNEMTKGAVPFLDVKFINARHRELLAATLDRVLDSGWYILGDEVERFEAEFAAYCGVEHCVGVGNGLEAMHLVLRAWGIGAGD